jgi:hypothetical protein
MDLAGLGIDTLSIESTAPSVATSPSLSAGPLHSDGRSAADISKDSPSLIHHKGTAYKRGPSLPKKKSLDYIGYGLWEKRRTMYVAEKKFYWLCSSCLEEDHFRTSAATSTHWIKSHLKKAHSLTENSEVDADDGTDGNDGNDDNRTSRLKYVSLLDFGLLKQRLIEWIVVMRITFSQVENEWFRRFLEVLSPKLTSWIPRSGDTIRNWILTEFKRRQNEIKSQLQASKSLIQMSFDLWTSPNHLSIVGIHGHFMSPQYKVDSILLGLRRLRGPHSGENIAEAIVSVIKKIRNY